MSSLSWVYLSLLFIYFCLECSWVPFPPSDLPNWPLISSPSLLWGALWGQIPPALCRHNTVIPFFFFFFLFFLRKISPELISPTNPPLFAEEDWPWADIRAHLPLAYMWEAWHSMAWWMVHRSVPGIPTGKPQATEGKHVNLTTTPLGWPQVFLF